MAKKKNTTKKAVTEKPENKAQSFEAKETKKAAPAKFNGGVIIDGIFYKMGEAKSRLMVKEGKAKLA
jgi:hypothetical protein